MRDGGQDETHLNALGDRERAGELAEAALADGVATLVAVALHRALARDGEHVVTQVDVDVLLGEPGELELRGHHVPVLILMQVHPARGRGASAPVEGTGGREWSGEKGARRTEDAWA